MRPCFFATHHSWKKIGRQEEKFGDVCVCMCVCVSRVLALSLPPLRTIRFSLVYKKLSELSISSIISFFSSLSRLCLFSHHSLYPLYLLSFSSLIIQSLPISRHSDWSPSHSLLPHLTGLSRPLSRLTLSLGENEIVVLLVLVVWGHGWL